MDFFDNASRTCERAFHDGIDCDNGKESILTWGERGSGLHANSKHDGG